MGAGAVQAQMGAWTAHTSMREVVAVAASPEIVWAATTGGVFGYDVTTGAFDRFTPVEGLSSIEATALAFDAARSHLWIGYQDGVMDRLDVQTGTVRTIRDIARAGQFPNRRINRIVVHGDSIFVATAFGVVVYDPVREEVRDTYSRLGTLPPTTAVHDVAVAPVPGGGPGLWLGTDRGIAHAALATVNLQDPAAWTVEVAGLPGPDPVVHAVAGFEGRLYAGTPFGLYRRQPDGRYASAGVTGRAVTDLHVAGDRLFGVERFNLFVLEPGGQGRLLQADGFTEPTSVMTGPDGNLWFGDALEGLVAVATPDAVATKLTVLQRLVPEGPFNDQFVDMTFDRQGNLWAGEVGAGNSGFYRRSPDGRWTSYLGRFFGELAGTGRYTSVHADAQGNVWAASEGGGLVQVTPEGTLVRYDSRNASLLPASGTDNFVIVGGVASDPDGTIWATTRASPRPLHVRTPDGTWTALPPYTGQGLTFASTAYGRIYVDAFEQKWIVIRNENNLGQIRGLMILDTGGTPTDPSDDVFRFLDEEGGAGRGLPSPAVTAVVEDQEGLVWIGTEEGLAFMINTGIVARDPNNVPSWPTWADRSRGTFTLFGLRINGLAVDPANRLWAATNEGAWLIRAAPEGGYDLVAHFSTDNSPLFSNTVLSVAVDARTGQVYFATDRGLLSYQGDAVAPAEKPGDLFVYPNPVVLADGDTPDIIIEGLVQETEVRIVAPHGAVVARLSARGGRVRWDGRDLDGRLVPSGVYLVIAVGQNNEGTAYGKVAVIR
ncbi:regulator [Rhodocaloribacter litoris]|nr:regulator [Rhodocaloribacter litoris]